MGLGFALLRLTPDAFWALSPREFFASLRALRGEGAPMTPPARASLEALMARYPDPPNRSATHG